MIFRCYFSFKKKSYKIKKEKNTTLVDGTVEHTSPKFYRGFSPGYMLLMSLC